MVFLLLVFALASFVSFFLLHLLALVSIFVFIFLPLFVFVSSLLLSAVVLRTLLLLPALLPRNRRLISLLLVIRRFFAIRTRGWTFLRRQMPRRPWFLTRFLFLEVCALGFVRISVSVVGGVASGVAVVLVSVRVAFFLSRSFGLIGLFDDFFHGLSVFEF